MLDLDGSWEIGLAEIQYPHSWYNVRINEVWVLFTDRHHEQHVLVLPEVTPLVTSATYGAL
jgi:hypothetical protein